jgi:hypothetical protein
MFVDPVDMARSKLGNLMRVIDGQLIKRTFQPRPNTPNLLEIIQPPFGPDRKRGFSAPAANEARCDDTG